MSKKKISLIGSGMIGGTLAHLLFMKQYADIILVDTNNDIPRTIVDINENSDRILNTIANDNKIIIVL